MNNMVVEKHIVVKEIGTLTYSEVSPVYKKSSSMVLDTEGYCGYDILINPPLQVKWKYSEISIMNEVTMVKKVDLEYDFGMMQEFFPERVIRENPPAWKYRGIDLNSPIIDVVKRYVEDELIFACFRNPCELSHTHWALRGWLRGRAIFPWHNQLVKL